MDNFVNNLVWFFLISVFSYLSGSILWAIIIAKISGKDVRKLGTKNPGMANTTLQLGAKYGSFVLIGDISTAFFSLFFIKYLLQNVFDFHPIVFSVFAAIFLLGSFFPIFHSFKGGSGLAKLLGILLVLNPLVVFINVPLGILLLFKIKNTEWKFVGSGVCVVITTMIVSYSFNYSYNIVGLQYDFPDFWGLICMVFSALLVLIRSEYRYDFFVVKTVMRRISK
jgi:glycerol-3-phosphate acyltransferase PlsY